MKITVNIHGETDWVQFTYNTKEIDLLKNPNDNLSLLGAKLGQLLDGNPVEELKDFQKEEIRATLGRYVANLKSYNLMIESGSQSILITSFRIKDGTRRGYSTRVAGIIPTDLSETEVFLNGLPFLFDGNYLILLNALKKSTAFYKEKYDKQSMFHNIMRQAKMVSGKIEFRSQADPRLQ